MLGKVLKFSATRMQYAYDDQKGLSWVVMWAKRWGKREGQIFRECGAKRMKIMEQPTLDQNENKDYQYSNPNWHSPINYLGNELTMPFIHNKCFS